MSTHSFGDPNAQPPTPKQTPTSVIFPSSVFETPKDNRGSFEESSGWTPRFAEEYSVFNSTPGNLRGGSQAPFVDFSTTTPYQPSSLHKRQLSAESFAAEIATHVTHFSPNTNLPLPPVEPARRLRSSPGPLATGQSPTEEDFQTGPQHQASTKKARRGTLLEPNAQTATPPPSARKGERRLAPKIQAGTMQNEGFEQEFVAGTPQQHMPNFAPTPSDFYGYPLSAPATAPGHNDSPSFWGTGMSGMDIDFSTAGSHVFQHPNHRPMNSLDWGKSNEIFQETGVVPPQNQENNPPPKKERVLAPKPPMPSLDTSMTDTGMFGPPFPAPGDDTFAMMGHGSGVDPGLLFTQPPPPGMEPATFDPMTHMPLMQPLPLPEPLPLPVKQAKRAEVRRSASTKERGTGKKVDRMATSSTIKPNGRPGLSRSFSENRGRKPVGRGSNLPNLAPAVVRPGPQASSARPAPQGSRAGGRTSPSKNQHHRLSSLTSIPESIGPQHRTSVKFTIDSRGRARAETTRIVDGHEQAPVAVRHQKEKRSSSKNWGSSEEDDSSTDDEPIIIPSRNTSFAVPDPRNQASARRDHSSQRSFSEQSTSSLGIYYNEPGASHDDAASEAETVMNVPDSGSRGDAASELRKVVENRQKRAMLNTGQRFVSGPPYSASGAVSPTTLTDASIPTPSSDRGNQIRCICNTTDSHINGDGYMVQW